MPMKALCLSFKMVYQHLLYLLSLWTYRHFKITQGPTRFSMGILGGVKRQTSRAGYNGQKQQWCVASHFWWHCSQCSFGKVLHKKFSFYFASPVTSLQLDAHVHKIVKLDFSIYWSFMISACLELPADLLSIIGLEQLGRQVWLCFPLCKLKQLLLN